MLLEDQGQSNVHAVNVGRVQPIDYEKRRSTFLAKIKNSVAIFVGAKEQFRNADTTHPFRQDSAFYYLTGFAEPNALCLLSPNSKTPFQLFVPPKDKTRELWDGKRLGVEGAKSMLKADAAFSSTDTEAFDKALVACLKETEKVYFSIGLDAEADTRILKLLQRTKYEMRKTGRTLWSIHDPGEILNEMRVIKSKAELQRMEIAANITSEAHAHAMRIARPGMFEYEVEAALYHTFRIRGAGREAYGSIVASGENACCLHYHANNRRMAKGDLLLIDAAAEFDYYASDVTRTFPVSGTFTLPQREIYEAVLRIQKACISMVKPGKPFRDIHETAIELTVEELKRLKVLKGSTTALIKKLEHRKFYPHSLGHWLGMDTHDVGREYEVEYTKNRRLEAGMVITIEPGIYFQPDDSGNSRYRGIGVRIEDDVVVTSNGHKVLSTGAPKEVDEVESLCSQI